MAVLRDGVPAGNPSSVHAEGRHARAGVEAARARIGAFVGTPADNVVFMSGGSEANATALRPGALRARDGRPVERLLVGATEHPSVLQGHRFPDVEPPVRVDGAGRIDLDDLRTRLTGAASTLVSIQAANSETGVIQALPEILAVVHEAGAVLHVDAVQAAGRIPLAFDELGIAAMSLSSHKLGGPMGIGALVIARDLVGPEAALVSGGGQQRGLRAGTENVPGIVGFGIACEAAARDLVGESARLAALRDAAERAVRRLAPDAVIFGAGICRLPNTLSFAVPGLKAATAVMALDLSGIAVSSGSACSSGKVGRSHVLGAMGLAEGEHVKYPPGIMFS